MTDNIQDKIDQYLLGEMSAAESKRFETELGNDKELNEQYRFTKMVRDELREQVELKLKMQNWRRDMNSTSFSLKYIIGGIAAVVAIGIFLLIPDFNDSEPSYGNKRDNSDQEVIQSDSAEFNYDKVDSLLKSHPDFK